ncbi:helix-turn-helix domain-containing protein [Bacillus fonticola]|uniref:helix-turn-helix domain-containing protein n=1 Tax=Bacillus fonticola TaxID=2728853 RepID=UPI001475C0A9|nr:helix-turn-helix domain-containing protein [Bacillus fonticola]
MIGDRVKTFRKVKKLSITELAYRAGVAKSYISDLERDAKSNPSIHFIEKIAKVLDVPVDELIGRDSPALDGEWRQVLNEVMESGISKEQFREFIEFHKWKVNGGSNER